MSVSYLVTFHRKPTDPQWEKNLAAAQALYDADIYELPPKLAAYFGTDINEPAELVGKLQVGTYLDACYTTGKPLPRGVTPLKDVDSSGYEIDLDELSDDVRVIRVRMG